MKKYGFLITIFIHFLNLSAAEKLFPIDILNSTRTISYGSSDSSEDDSDSSPLPSDSSEDDSDSSPLPSDPDYAKIVSESFNGCKDTLKNVQQKQADILARLKKLELINRDRTEIDETRDDRINSLTDCVLALQEKSEITNRKPAQRTPKNLLPLQQLQNLIILLGASSIIAIYWHLLLNSFSDNSHHPYVVD